MMNDLFKPVRPKAKPIEKKKVETGEATESGKKNLFVDARDSKSMYIVLLASLFSTHSEHRPLH